jgi:hypothetical protein
MFHHKFVDISHHKRHLYLNTKFYKFFVENFNRSTKYIFVFPHTYILYGKVHTVYSRKVTPTKTEKSRGSQKLVHWLA